MTHISSAVHNSEIDAERRVNLVPYPGLDRRSLTRRGFQKNDVYGHRLETTARGDWLPAAVVLSRLYKEFLYFETDEELGKRHAEQLVACFESSLKHGFSVQRQRHLQLLTNGIDSAIYLHFGDNPGSNTAYLETVLIPQQPLVFGYQSIEHRLTAAPLLERCASVLGYELFDLRVGR